MATIPASENEFPQILMSEVAAPSTPAAGLIVAYAKSDGKFYWKDDAGTEYAVATGDLAAHLSDATDAHDASAVSFDPTGLTVISGTEVQTALEEVDAAIGAGGIPLTLIDAKGDLIAGSAADTAVRVPAGTNGWYLAADSAQSSGLRWMEYATCRLTGGSSAVSSTSFADAPGMTLPVAANKNYIFKFVARFTTNASTVGIKLAVNGPAAGAPSYLSIVQRTAAAGGGNTVVMDAPGSYDFMNVPDSGPAGGGGAAIFDGIYIGGANAGNLVLRHASETATTTTLIVGTYGQLWEIA